MQAALSSFVVQILSAVVKPSATTSFTFSGKICCGTSRTLGAASAGNLAQIYANRGDVKAAGAIGKANASSTLLGSLGSLAGFFGFS